MTCHRSPLNLHSLVAVVIVMLALPGYAVESPQRIVRLGFVSPDSPSTVPPGYRAFWERLRELGYEEGRNLIVDTRWAEGRYDRLPHLMAEVAGLKVDVLVTYTTPAGIAARNATRTIPIVDAHMGDPVGTGLVASLARPGGNLTGLSQGFADISGKWLELLKDTIPRLSTVAVIENPDNPLNVETAKRLDSMAPTLDLKLSIIKARNLEALDNAFGQASRKAQAALLLPDNVFALDFRRVTALATKYRLPVMYFDREFVVTGGLMAYAPDISMIFRRAAEYVDKILKGAKPAELPVEQPNQYELAINLKAARALGINMPDSVLVRANEVMR